MSWPRLSLTGVPPHALSSSNPRRSWADPEHPPANGATTPPPPADMSTCRDVGVPLLHHHRLTSTPSWVPAIAAPATSHPAHSSSSASTGSAAGHLSVLTRTSALATQRRVALPARAAARTTQPSPAHMRRTTEADDRQDQHLDPDACVKLGPPHRGAGPRPWRRRIRRTAVADTCTPRLRHSPTIRR
jgi:hypothetical protein